MNRTIKFRGKTFHDEWVYGVPVPSADRKMWAIFGNFNDLLEPFDKVTVRPETIGQFTGFGDVNATPIYEGDIIRIQALPAVRLSVAVNNLTGAFAFASRTYTEGEIYGTTPLGEVLKCYNLINLVTPRAERLQKKITHDRMVNHRTEKARARLLYDIDEAIMLTKLKQKLTDGK